MTGIGKCSDKPNGAYNPSITNEAEAQAGTWSQSGGVTVYKLGVGYSLLIQSNAFAMVNVATTSCGNNCKKYTEKFKIINDFTSTASIGAFATTNSKDSFYYKLAIECKKCPKTGKWTATDASTSDGPFDLPIK